MDQNQQSIFGLSVDDSNRAHLSEAAKWGRFLAIVGFVVCGLIVLGGIIMVLSANRLQNEMSDYPGYRRSAFSVFGAGLAFVYIVVAVVYFFPCLFLLRFSNAMKIALAGNDQDQLTESFKNLKVMFRYVGIILIILLSIYAFIFLIAILSAAT
jgi:hypothetical protein